LKVTKLVIGILMIVLSLFIFFESMAAGFVNTVENKEIPVDLPVL
jgi:hypothetical protein